MNQDEIERNIAFIIEQQASFWTDLQELKQVDRHTERRLDRLERLFLLGVGAGRRERRARHELEAKIDALVDAQINTEELYQSSKRELDAKFAALAKAQTKTDAKFAALVEAQTNTDAKFSALAEAQTKTDAKFAALVEAQTKAEELAQQARRDAEARFALLVESQAQMNAALAELARVLVQTNGRIDTLSAK